MSHVIAITTRTKKQNRLALLLGGLVILALLLTACGGATTSASNGAASIPQAGQASSAFNQPAHSAASGAPAAASSAQGQRTSSTSTGAPYLIKSLAVNMEVKDTRRVAADLQAWINTTDPRSSSAGVDYKQVGDNLYSVSMQFSVQATLYTQVKLYLETYNSQYGGQLVSLHETIQDVTNDFVDSQSRLRNLRGEQQRLLTLLSSAGAIGDVLAIEQKLTDVEGQIEDLEAHLNALNGQVTYYTVSINLQPIAPASPPPPPAAGWNALQILQDAWAASVAFGEALLTLFIWLLTFSIYIIPVAVIAWFVWQRRRAKRLIAPLEAPVTHSQAVP